MIELMIKLFSVSQLNFLISSMSDVAYYVREGSQWFTWYSNVK